MRRDKHIEWRRVIKEIPWSAFGIVISVPNHDHPQTIHTHADVPHSHDTTVVNAIGAGALLFNGASAATLRLESNLGANSLVTSLDSAAANVGNSGAVQTGTAGAGAAFLQSAKSANVYADPINSIMSGLRFGNAAEADSIVHGMRIPSDIDLKFPVGFRVIWLASSNNAAHTATWVVKYSALSENGEMVLPATVLNTPVVNQSIGAATSYLMKRTARGIINVGNLLATHYYLNFKVYASALPALGNLWLRSVEFDFMPQLCKGAGNVVDRTTDR